jgi:anti-sigma factor RsiW
MLNAAHIADCEDCRRKLAECESMAAILKTDDRPVAGGHVPPELQAGYVEKQLTRQEREQVEEHVATCSDCREELVALSEIIQESTARSPVRWSAFVTGGVSALAGAAAMLLIFLVMPTMQPGANPSVGRPGVVVYGSKGGPADATAALRVIEPSDADLDFAIAVWKRVVKDNPGDKVARLKLEQLEKRRSQLKRDR